MLFAFICISITTHAQPPQPPTGYRWVLNDQYSDEFNGSSLDITKWQKSFPNWQGRVPAKFEPSAVSVAGGYLQIKSGKYTTPQGAYTMYGGAVTSLKETAHYGYYECKLKTSKIAMSTTFWLSNSKQPYLPTACTTDTYSQELDVVEAVGDIRNTFPSFKTKMKSNSHHRYVPCGASSEIFYSNGTDSAPLSSEVWEDYHTYGTQWHNAKSATFYSDGRQGQTVLFNTTIDTNPFDRPMFMAMVTETYDWLTPYPSDSELNNNAINTAYYDWIRSYRLIPISDPEPINNLYALDNGNFENGNLNNWTGYGTGTRSVTNINPYEGNYAAYIKGIAAHERIINLKPNTTYILNAYAKVLAGKIILGAKENTGAQTFLNSVTISSPTYTRANLEFTTGTETNIKFYFYAQTTTDEAYADNFEIKEKNPSAKAAVFTETISYNNAPVITNNNIAVSYTYKANIDREIQFHLFDSGNNEVYATTINGLEGYGNHDITFSIGSTLPNGNYSLVADIRPKGGSNTEIIASVTSAPITLSLRDFNRNDFKIELYPNPASDLVHIKTEALQGKTSVDVYDILGKQLMKTEFENNQLDLDLSPLAKGGTYFIVLKNKEKSSTKKVVIK